MIDLIYQKYKEANYRICTDSRNIIPGSVFFALKGEAFDGNRYAEEALKKGAITAVIDNESFKNIQGTIFVPNTLEALQTLARKYRIEKKFNVFGLTGTNGKTTTKELIKAVLEQKYKCHATLGNLNNHIGVPLTILSAPEDTDILVVEMGANHQGEIADLCEICLPDIGLITNIGKAHLEGFGGYKGVIKAKSELYKHLIKNNKKILLNEKDHLLVSLLDDYNNTEGYGSTHSNVWTKNTGFNNGVTATISINNTDIDFKTKLVGNYNITNILTAIKTGDYFNVPINKIKEAIQNYSPSNNRSQLLVTKKNSIIMDSYNANPTSMLAALNSFDEILHKNKILILGAMKELGSDSESEHLILVEKAKSLKPEQLLLVGKEYFSAIKHNALYFKNTEEIGSYLKNTPIENKLILIKGSRANKLETITKYL